MRASIIDATGSLDADQRAAVRRTLRLAAGELDLGAGELSVRLVSEEEMAQLNGRWRKRRRPTDVLSFPAVQDPSPRRQFGDIAICVEVARSQARGRRHALERELALLALHGLLHLLGHDHETDEGEMERLERRLRRLTLPRRGTER